MNAPHFSHPEGTQSHGHLPATGVIGAPQLLAEYQSALSKVEQLTITANRLDHERATVLARLSSLSDQLAIADEHPDHGELMHRSTASEVALVTRTGHLAAAHRIAQASTLVTRYPRASAALREGELSVAHTDVITTAGNVIATVEARARYEADVLPLALEMTAHQLKPHAKRLAEVHAERTIDERYDDARTGREVRVTSLDDGMAKLTATLGAVEAFAIKDRLSRIARVVHQDERRNAHATDAGGKREQDKTEQPDPRTRAQVELDVLVELLLTGGSSDAAAKMLLSASAACARLAATTESRGKGNGSSGNSGNSGDPLAAITGRVQVSVPVFALAGSHGPEVSPYLSPAELAGYGPIPRSVAMKLAGGSKSWARVMTHPVSGAVLAVDRYQPSEDLKRLLGARDQHCRFMGCITRLDRCDIDHTVAYSEGGTTSPENTGHLCRRHHVLKHWKFMKHSGWHPVQSEGGVYTWRAPSGRHYRDTPKSSVRFRPHRPRAKGRAPAEANAPPGF
ncbi:MAG: DUF222 domain-containing protein [Microbacteriaceae bacterium]|nr:DUF222 domain-containing protein [Microbacteriaceae bacterium]